jgi:hypothetical protein
MAEGGNERAVSDPRERFHRGRRFDMCNLMTMRKAAWIPLGLACMVSCGDSAGREAIELTRRDSEPAGANCAYGGFAIHSGVDRDGDDALENDEIIDTAYECNPATTMLSREDELAPSLECPGGGTAHRGGIDDNNDGVLQDSEIDQTAVVCNSLEHWRGDFVAEDWSDPVKVAALRGARVVDGSLAISTSAQLPQLEIVHGDVVAQGMAGSVILGGLREVDGNFEINARLLLTLSVPALERVGGDLSIGLNTILALTVPSLREVGGRLVFRPTATGAISLPQLTTVGGVEDEGDLFELHLDALATVTGAVTISDRSFAGLQLPSLTTIGGDLGITNTRLATIDLPVLGAVSGDVRIDNAHGLKTVSLPSLDRVGGDVAVQSMIRLTTLDLDRLTEIAGRFSITTTALDTLRLSRLRTVGPRGPGTSGFEVTTTELREIDLPSLASVSGAFRILGNFDLQAVRLPALMSVTALSLRASPALEVVAAPLVASLDQLFVEGTPALTTLDVGNLAESTSIVMTQCGLPDLSPLRALTTARSILLSGMDRLQDLRGLSSLQNLLSLNLTRNAALVSLDGLESIATGVNSVNITDNPVLASTTGLRSLASLSGSLTVRRNALLPRIELASLASIGGNLTIADNPEMTTLSGLDPLTSVVGAVIVTGNDRIPASEVAAFLARLGR